MKLRWSGTGRYIPTLASMVLLFLMVPALQFDDRNFELLDEVLTVLLLTAVFVLRTSKAALAIGLLLALPGRLFAWWGGPPLLGQASLVCEFILVMLAAGFILAEILRDRRVTAGTVSGALCVYLLMGIAWGYCYMLLAVLNPAAFHFPGGQPADPAPLFMDLLYFSFITLTTLGYGDITPVVLTARSLAILEAVSAQLYLAVLVARLVGMHAASGRRRRRGRKRGPERSEP